MNPSPISKTEACRDIVAHIADIHFWRVVVNPFHLMNKRFLGNLTVLLRRRFEFVLERAESFADHIAATGVKTVLLTGDFTSTSTAAEFALAAQFVRGLTARGLAVHLVPGNHDVYTFESVRKRRWERYFEEFLPPGGYPAATRLPGGTSLVLAPTVCPRYLSARGLITQQAVEQVGHLLKSCGDSVIVAAHYPVLHDTRGYHSNPFHQLANAQSLRRTLGMSGKRILYLCGHVHRFSYERDTDYPSIEYLSTGAFLCNDDKRGIQGEFAEIRAGGKAFDLLRHVKRGNAWAVIPPQT